MNVATGGASVSGGGGGAGGAAPGGSGGTGGANVGGLGSDGGSTAAGAGGSTSGTSGGAGTSAGGAGNGGDASAGSTSGGAVQGGAAGSTGTGAGGSAGGGAPVTENPTLFIASDSTASTYGANTTQGGWGQFFQEHFQAGVTVVNRSRGGRNARRFIDAADEQSLDLIWDAAEPGDYLFVQFGTNDSNNGGASYVNVDGDTIPYYLDPQTDFKTWLRVYIDGARERMVTPVLVTPPPRRSCTGDSRDFGNGTARWATAMKELAVEKGTALIDLNQKTLAHLNLIGCVASAEFFFDNGVTVDGTHFSKTGAALMAGFVADGITEAGLPLAALVE